MTMMDEMLVQLPIACLYPDNSGHYFGLIYIYLTYMILMELKGIQKNT